MYDTANFSRPKSFLTVIQGLASQRARTYRADGQPCGGAVDDVVEEI